MKCGSFISHLIYGPSKIPTFSFSTILTYERKCFQLNVFLQILYNFTNHFIRPGFICSDGRTILSQGAKASMIKLRQPTTVYSPRDQYFLAHCSCFVPSLQRYKEKGYFVYSLCWTRRKLYIFESTQIDHGYSWYFIFFKSNEKIWYSSFFLEEW